MKPILIHLHIYYPHLYEELKSCILNLSSYEYKLFVTMVEEHQDVIEDIKESFRGAVIEIVENKGYDIGPFVHVINKVNLDEYSYILKLHTKRDVPIGANINNYKMSGSIWRNTLLEPVRTKENAEKSIGTMESLKKIGMVADYRIIIRKEYWDKQAQESAYQLMENLGFSKIKYGYIAGSMFFARASLFKKLQELKLDIEDFEAPTKAHSSSSAHVVERLLGSLVLTQGYEIRDVISNKKCRGGLFMFLRGLKFIISKEEFKPGLVRVSFLGIPIYKYKLNKAGL